MHVRVNEKSSVVANLTVKKSPPTLEFTTDDGQEIFTDALGSFRTFRLDEANNLECCFESPSTSRKFTFQRDSDSSKFLDVLSKANLITGVPGQPFCFTVNAQEGQNLLGYVNKFYQSIAKDAGPGTVRQVDAVVFGTIDVEVPSRNLVQLTKEDAETSDLKKLLFSTLDVKLELFPIIFDRLLDVGECNMTEYLKVKKQWQLTSRGQWLHNNAMRVFVHDIEGWLELLQSVNTRKVVFNVGMSLFTWHFGETGVKSHIQFIFLVFIIFLAYVGTIRDHEIIGLDQKSYTYEEMENVLFWKSKELVKRVVAATSTPLKDSLAIRSMLSSISASTLEMLNDRSMTSLDFAFYEADSFFAHKRKRLDSLLLTAAAIVSDDITAFRQYGIVVALILAQKKLQEIPVNDAEEFNRRYHEELRGLDTRLLLYNIEKLFAMARH